MDIKRKMCFRVTDENELCTPIYRHTIKIKTNYGATNKWLVFEILTPKVSSAFTITTLMAFIETYHEGVYKCVATGNVAASNGTTTGICFLEARGSNRTWSGMNSGGDSFSFYIQDDFSDVVTEVK